MIYRPRVAVVRGSHLNPFEMQTYAAMTSQFDLTAYATYDNQFDFRQVDIPVRRLHRPKELGCDIPRWRGFCNLTARLLLGSEDRMLGLTRALSAYDIVHTAETYNYYSFQAVQAKAACGVRVAVTIWDNIPYNWDDTPRYAQCKSEVRERADIFLAVTEQAKAMLMTEGVDAERIRVIGAGIDVERFRPGPSRAQMRRRFGLLGSETTILFVGSMIESKGVHILLEAVRLLYAAGTLRPNHHRVLLVGRGGEECRLRALTTQWDLDQIVTFGGSASYVEMPEVHRLADIFVLPSIPMSTWEEQFGMVLAESMATGKPVVSTNSGAIPEVVGSAGYLVPPGNAIALAEALHELLVNDARRTDLGCRARARIESTFAHHLVAARIVDAYQSLL